MRRQALRSLRCLGVLVWLMLSLTPGLPSRAQVGAPQVGANVRLPLIMLNYSPGTVTGQVIDASNRSSLVGASVCTSPTRCVLTDNNGIYSIAADSGQRSLTAYGTGHYSVAQQVMVHGNQSSTLNFALSPYLSGGNVDRRMVLTWSANPYWCEPEGTPCTENGTENDLDAHLWMKALLAVHIPDSDPSNPNPRGDCVTYPNACLELDTRKGFGPETIAITHFELQTIYYYGVLDYNYGAPGVPPITETGAHVEVYDQTGPLMSFDVPQTGSGNFWYVFNYTRSSQTGNWVIEPVNCIALYSENIDDILAQCQPPG